MSILLISCCNVRPSPVSFGAPARWPHELEKPNLDLSRGAEAISGVLFSGFIPSRDGFDFGFLIRRFVHRRRRSYYLFFNYLSYYL